MDFKNSTIGIVRKHLPHVAYRNTVTLVNIIFLVVTLLLLLFKEAHEALFLGIVLFMNIVIGIIQDMRAQVSLERLQILMTPKIIRLSADGRETEIRSEDACINDRIKIALGDQVPADGELLESNGIEINEALLTGESDNIRKNAGDSVLAGSIVAAGSGIMRVMREPKDSFVSHMTEKIKQFDLNLSPIQRTLTTFIKYMAYLLLIIALYVIIHGLSVHELVAQIVKDIAALTGTLVPQGLILATTIFFAYGAVQMFKKQVLLQEINATEKLGRIKNLCVDKTGTLTENKPVMEKIVLYGSAALPKIEAIVNGYMQATGDNLETAQTILASAHTPFAGSVSHALPFSSERKYGMATLEMQAAQAERVRVVMGAPDILLPNISSEPARTWLTDLLAHYGPEAKRLVLLAKILHHADAENLGSAALEPIALFVLSNPLRPGTKDIIDFFQNRGVRIRVISGDNAETVRAIALQAGIKHANMVITGAEIDEWKEEDYKDLAPAYSCFARIKPDQKEKIITALKFTGFTAMIGDGANDALAIKKADLGIAMFEGAKATRQIAEVVLMNNSFAALPVGVQMAETIITNIELVSNIFFNKVAVGFLLFLVLSFLGYTYPLSPRSTTIVGYFAVWFPIIFWSIFPARKAGINGNTAFLKKILPFVLVNAFIITGAAVTAFLLSPHGQKITGTNIQVVLVLLALGFWFFILTSMSYGIAIRGLQKNFIIFAGVLGIFLLGFVFYNPVLSGFFDLHPPHFWYFVITIINVWIFGWLQLFVTRQWFIPKIPISRLQ